MRRRRWIWGFLVAAYVTVLVTCCSCVNTQQAIAPATLGDLWLGVEADVESLLMLFVGI